MDESRAQPASRLVIGTDDAGGRLDRVLADWRGLSRAAVLRLLDASAVTRNGRAVAHKEKGAVLNAGDVLEIDGRFTQAEAPLADRSAPLHVLAQGPGWLAIDKPAGVPVRPHALDETGTVLNAVAARYPDMVGVGEGGLRSGVVHRLDNDTSGVLLLATEQEAWLRLRDAFKEHHVRKRYMALVHGRPRETGESAMHLRVARHAPAHVDVCQPSADESGARRCSLAWRVVEPLGSAGCLIEVDLHTGFLHQVRVMMSAMGHPVVGDRQYGDAQPRFGAARHMLHAASVAFEDVSIASPTPEDFKNLATAMRSDANAS